MYNYDDKTKTYNFKGSLSKYLLSRGIKKADIVSASYRILESNFRDAYYEPTSFTETRIIPLDRVIGTNRSRPWTSVYDNVNTIKKEGLSLDYRRFEGCFKKLEEFGIDKLKESYLKLNKPIDITYYEDEDVYYVDIDGNHRTLTAMLVGAKYILAIVNHYKCDINKKMKYDSMVSMFKTKYNINKIYNDAGVEYNLLDCLIHYSENKKVNIEFSCSGQSYIVNNYDLHIKYGNLENAVRQLSDQIEDDLKS